MELRHFLEIPYDELEQKNLESKKLRSEDPEKIKQHYIEYLKEESRLKAVTLCFTDLEGRFHMIDYDKKFLLNNYENLTFDSSSIRGFSKVRDSELRLGVDWKTFRWLPSDLFGPGKVIIFGLIYDKEGQLYDGDYRGKLQTLLSELKKESLETQVAVECEGFLFKGLNSEQSFSSRQGFELVSNGGYFHSLPKDPLKVFIDSIAEAQRALGFENEKDHPEVAPSQFELNYKYTDALLAADQLLLYKLVAKQAAANMGYTACFLPKPIAGINGNGLHTNISVLKKGTNLFYDKSGEDNLSKFALDFVDRILNHANDLCLILNSSVNAYRRLDPSFEAPNQIKYSSVDQTSMIRIPSGNEKTARVEIRAVAPDTNPYLAFYSILKTGFYGESSDSGSNENKRFRTRFLPSNIYDSIRLFKSSEYTTKLLGEDLKEKFINLKIMSADRCPKELGRIVKSEEILFHHEVTNQFLWSRF